MNDEKTIDEARFEEDETDEEFPILETLIDKLYFVQKKLGSGGMGFVYQVSIENLYRLRAKEIIAGNMELAILGLKPEDLGLEEEPRRIHDEHIKEKIYQKADDLEKTTRSILKTDQGTLTDTRILIQNKLMSDTHEKFRKVIDKNGNLIAAMKVLNKSLCQDKNKVKRLQHEGIAFKKLKHPNLVKSIDVGSFDVEVEPGKIETGYHYVMEFIEPYNFEEHFEQKQPPLPVKFAVPIPKSVLSACSYLHEQGIIHRDIKPSNIMIEKKSFLECLVDKAELDVRLSDLGLARFHFTGSESGSTDMPSQIVTQEGAVAGTPSYMSPEQINTPTQTGSATDIWSIAATIYHLFTGHVPIGEDCDSAYSVMAEITKLDRPKPIREYNPNFPQTLEDLTMLNFIAVTPKLKEVERTKKGKKIEVWVAVKDENGRVIYDVNNRLTAEEWGLAIEDYESIQNNPHTDEELVSLIKEKDGTKSEELARLYFDALGRIERDRITETEYDCDTVNKRINLLERAIESTENKTRKAYLEKILFYEERLPIYHEPEPAIPKIPEPPKKMSKAQKTAITASILGIGAIGSIFGVLKILDLRESNQTYNKILNNIAGIEQNINSDKELTQTYLLQLTTDIILQRDELKEERRKLSRDSELELEKRIDALEKNKTKLVNEWLYMDSKKLLDENQAELEKRNYFEAGKKIDAAEKQTSKIQIEGEFVSYKPKRTELEKIIKERKEILAGKQAALSTLKMAGEQYKILIKTYGKLKSEVDDGAPFPKQEEIKKLQNQLEIHQRNLETVSVEFCDENENIVDENFEKTQTNIITLEKNVNREILFGIANHKLSELVKLNTKVTQDYVSEKAPEIHGQAKTLYDNIEKIIQETNTSVLDPEKIDKFNDSLSKESTKIEKDTKIIEHFTDLRKKSSEGDQNAKEILTLEKRTRSSANKIYIRNGITTETITEYSNKVNTYLNGKNMRADTYIQLTLDELSNKLPEHKEMIETLKEQAKPLFSLSWKIQELDGIIDEKPEDEKVKQEREKAITDFTKTATELKKQFSDLNLMKYVAQGTATAEPSDYFYLGKAYQTRGDKTRAAQSYAQFLKTAKLGFQIGKEEIKQAEEAIKLAEQK